SVNAFRDIKLTNAKLVTYKTDKDNNLTLYVSKAASGNVSEVEVEFTLQETSVLNTEGKIIVDFESETDVSFTLARQEGTEDQVWHLKAVYAGNPVLDGQFADPDIDVFNGKYYMYTTTDGYPGWSGTVFHCFSSENLRDWVDEGIILDVASNDVKWSVGSAWAPTIEEKNGKYYFYFCAKCPSGESQIGVAVADKPEGPYTAMDTPLLTMAICKEAGVEMGQTIDPSIFTDDDGTSYVLFGNGRAAIVKLNDDMVSIDTSTLKNINNLKDFREAVTVTKRDGVYHFTWSCDDTGSPDYHINYGISDSLYGEVKNMGTILSKDTDLDILGTGHHCILHIPDTDEYYIAYHRFYTPLGSFTDGTGFHRETCIDKLTFDAETGYMQTVTPTLTGVAERVIAASNKTEETSTEEAKETETKETETKEPETKDSEVKEETGNTSGTSEESSEKSGNLSTVLIAAGVGLLLLGGLVLFKKKKK
nr:family 43 glycosylhydrolase [Lachnospiraceae bacterium]